MTNAQNNDQNNNEGKLSEEVRERTHKQFEKLTEHNKTLNQKVEDLEVQIKRVLADYQNLEKRVAEQRRELIFGANKDLLLRLLPILDTLVLASKHSQDKSLQVSIQQFLGVLENEGVKKIETVGKDFDPNTMEGIGIQEVNLSAGSGPWEGKVLEETRTGYMIGDRILRVAQVIVGKEK